MRRTLALLLAMTAGANAAPLYVGDQEVPEARLFVVEIHCENLAAREPSEMADHFREPEVGPPEFEADEDEAGGEEGEGGEDGAAEAGEDEEDEPPAPVDLAEITLEDCKGAGLVF